MDTTEAVSVVKKEITNINPSSLTKFTFVFGILQGTFVVPAAISATPGGPDGSVPELLLLLVLIVSFSLLVGISGYISSLIYNGITYFTGGMKINIKHY